MKKIVLAAFILLSGVFFANAQNKAPSKKQFIFSAIKGTVSKSDSITLPAATISVRFYGGDTSSFKILSYKKLKLILVFTPPPGLIGITKAKLQIRTSSGNTVLNLTGLSTKGLEGENEPTLANHSRPELQGDEIPYQLFHKAGKGKVEIIPVGRYSPDFELPFGYYID